MLIWLMYIWMSNCIKEQSRHIKLWSWKMLPLPLHCFNSADRKELTVFKHNCACANTIIRNLHDATDPTQCGAGECDYGTSSRFTSGYRGCASVQTSGGVTHTIHPSFSGQPSCDSYSWWSWCGVTLESSDSGRSWWDDAWLSFVTMAWLGFDAGRGSGVALALALESFESPTMSLAFLLRRMTTKSAGSESLD